MLRKLRAGLFTALLVAVTFHIVLWAVAPLVPYVLIGLVLVSIIGTLYYRKARWWRE
jgi:hypothetical protein